MQNIDNFNDVYAYYLNYSIPRRLYYTEDMWGFAVFLWSFWFCRRSVKKLFWKGLSFFKLINILYLSEEV